MFSKEHMTPGRWIALVICVGMLLAVVAGVSGCASVVDRYSSAPVRHPCGNIWDICPGDSPFWDGVRRVTAGGY